MKNNRKDKQMDYDEFSIDNLEDDEDDEDDDILVESKQRVIIEKADRSLDQFYKWFKEGRLIIDPEWQRNYVWKPKRAAKLIESFLIDIPVPVIYLAKNDESKYEVIDGQQRLSSIFSFFDNKFKLQGLEILTQYENKKFNQLPDEAKYKLQDVTLRSFELSAETSKDLLFTIFERLNTGGVALNRMEIRNCIYRGHLNNLIKKLAGNTDFLKCINQQGLSSRMKDRDLVLRFLAFYEKTYQKCTKGLGRFLNEFYEIYQDSNDGKIKEWSKIFSSSMKAVLTVFGENAYRLRSSTGGWNRRYNSAVFQAISTSFATYDLTQITHNADSIYEEYLDMISSDEKWRECVTSQTSKPAFIEYVFEQWYKRLKLVLENSQKNDSVRLFSHALK